MSEQTWQDMPAGAQLDALVAKALGLDVREDVWRKAVNHPRPFYIFESETEGTEFLSYYSTDLNTAWGLVKGIDGFALRVDAWSGSEYGLPFEANIPTEELYYVGEADTPALAICRCWLAWKEAQR